ncbi:MAG: hypothetical protein ACR2OY_12270 [Boseongicola sp.]
MHYTETRISRGALTAMIVAICGGACWFAICQSQKPPGIGNLYDMLRLTTASAAVGGFIASPLFGLSGARGLALALLASILATAIGAALAAGVIGGLPGIVIGPVFVLTSLVTQPHVGGTWLLIMIAAHCVAETERARSQV